MMFIPFRTFRILALFSIAAAGFGCNIVKKESKTPTLLKNENASRAELIGEVNRFSRINSLRAKMDLKFEDNSFAQFGSKEVYRSADGDMVVQRPASIFLKVQVPFFKTDVAQMTSDGEKFRVAVLTDGGSGKFKRFILGTNSSDYSRLQRNLETPESDKSVQKNVNAFSNLRPQHFTDALLVRPTSDGYTYVTSTIFQIEEDSTQPKKSPLRSVLRGYYLLDEYEPESGGGMRLLRRFWFDRVGGIRLARQQLFGTDGEIESDILYGRPGNLGDSPEYHNLPLRIQVTRVKEKYTMSLTYQVPGDVKIGETYPAEAFTLQNTWKLEELDLDAKLREVLAQQQGKDQSTLTRVQ